MGEVDQVPAGHGANVAEQFSRPSDIVGCKNDIFEGGETMRLDDWFARETIEGRPGNTPRRQHLEECVFVDDPTARGIKDKGIRFHQI